MSAVVTPAAATGMPAPVQLPPAAQLASAFRVTGPAGDVTPFYASLGAGPDAADHTNVVLLMIDISGSMNDKLANGQTRFEAAKSAIAQFVDGMQEGSDRIAIVPFESHNVVSTIHGAVYASRKSDAQDQLKALPTPASKNNTALYQAVFTGEESLHNEVESLRHEGVSTGVQPHLILMTDGKNEVLPGDDPQLLNGDLGLQQAAAQVHASHMDTIGIGFGDRAQIDAAALQRLSTRFFYAADATQLLGALHVSRSAVSHAITLTWLLPENSRVALAGRDQQWVPTLRMEEGSTLTGEPLRLLVPATAPPVFDRKASADELNTLYATRPEVNSGWALVLTHGLLYVAAALLLLLLWFWVPRLIWADEMMGVPDRKQRWRSERAATETGLRPGVKAASAVQVRSASLPEGFAPETANSSPLQRSAAQVTQIQSRGEFSRTRLNVDR
ncbi:hypothetical protein GCM10022270_10470 [Terriglobus aquaticus]